MFCTAPPLTIAAFTIIGAYLGGIVGAFLGFASGLAFVFVLGRIVRTARGGFMPRQLRRSLVTNLLAVQRAKVAAAFPGLDEASLYQAVDAAVESVAKKAVELSPSPDPPVAFSQQNVERAVDALCRAESSPSRADLYRAILVQMRFDWSQV